jgi:cytidine deaminase
MSIIQNKYLKYKNKYSNLQNTLMFGGTIPENTTDEDMLLINNLYFFAKAYTDKEYHPLAVAMLHKSGQIIYSLASKSPMGNDVHGEHAIMSAAKIYDPDRKFETIVCMTLHEKAYEGERISIDQVKHNIKDEIKLEIKIDEYKIKSPCGICRELLKHHYPNISIIVNNPNKSTNKFVKIKTKYLLPYPYTSTKTLDISKYDYSEGLEKLL